MCECEMSNSNMFRWERITQPRVYSRSQRLTTGSDVQDWIKTVQDASSRAAAVTFGTPYVAPPKPAVTHPEILDMRLHEAAYSEAQELLQQWAAEKLILSDPVLSARDSFSPRSDRMPKKTVHDVRHQWDRLSASSDDHVDGSVSVSNGDLVKTKNIKQKTGSTKDPFSLLTADEDDVVQSIINGMLRKELYSDDTVRDLGFDSNKQPTTDPRTKMNLRHLQVKENKERRVKEKTDRLKEFQAKKQAEFEVRQTIAKEEKVKEMKVRKEEEEIQKEMARLRKELEEERRRKSNELLRRKQEAERLESARKEERKRMEEAEMQARINCQQATDERRQKIIAKIQEAQEREYKANMKLKRQCFTTWYNIVIEHRILAGKAKAMSDWKLLFRTFCAWKSTSLGNRVEKETSRHERLIKEMHRNESRAVEHYRRRTLAKCMFHWREFVVAEQRGRELEHTRLDTRSKMAAFLDAAASGQLWTEPNPGTGNQSSVNGAVTDRQLPATSRSQPVSDRSPKDRGNRQPDTSNINRPSTARRPNSAQPPSRSAARRLSESRDGTYTAGGSMAQPTEAWQVTRRHLQLTAEQISTMGHDSTRDDPDSAVSTHRVEPTDTCRRPMTARTGGAGFTVNSFEHRHRVQQQLLEQQQQQLKEQRRLIEEMQALQRQQLLQQQIAGIKQGKTTAPGDDTTQRRHQQSAAFEPSHLHAHLASVQKDVVSAEHLDDVTPGEQDVVDTGSKINTNRTAASKTREPDSGRSDASLSSKPATNDSRHDKFLEAMQQRAAERERLRKEREEKRQKQEEERLLKLQQEVEERKLKEEEEKKEKLRQLRERKELERKKVTEKQKEVERAKELEQNAEEHHQRSIAKFHGWRPWRKLITDAQERETKANELYRRNLKRKVLLAWNICLREERVEKQKMADDLYRRLLVKRCLSDWTKYKQVAEIEERKAVRFYERHTKLKVVRLWAEFVSLQKESEQRNQQLAEQHNIIRIQRTSFRAWKRFPSVVRDAEKMKRRLLEMRKTVAAIVPDFTGLTPTLDDSDLD